MVEMNNLISSAMILISSDLKFPSLSYRARTHVSDLFISISGSPPDYMNEHVQKVNIRP